MKMKICKECSRLHKEDQETCTKCKVPLIKYFPSGMTVCEACAKTFDEVNETCPKCEGPLIDHDEAVEKVKDRIQHEHYIESFLELIHDTETLGEERPWYVPTLNTIGYSVPNIGCTIRLNIPSFSSPEDTRKWLLYMKEKQGFGKIFQWVICPCCGWDVPQAEITIKGYCFFCLKRKEKGNLCPQNVSINMIEIDLVCNTCTEYSGRGSSPVCDWKGWDTPDPEEKPED